MQSYDRQSFPFINVFIILAVFLPDPEKKHRFHSVFAQLFLALSIYRRIFIWAKQLKDYHAFHVKIFCFKNHLSQYNKYNPTLT